MTTAPTFDALPSLISAPPPLRKLADGFQFLEGPVWLPWAGGLLFSDIPADRLYLWRPAAGLSVFRTPSHCANGNTRDAAGNLLTCEHRTRRVSRTTPAGEYQILAEHYQGRRLNSPNDITVRRRDGSIWFTDPPYGIRPDEQEQPAQYVFRLDTDGTLAAVASDFRKPNGLAFSPDEETLYVSDTDNACCHIRRFQLRPDNSLAGGEILAHVHPGKPDGFRLDGLGRLWTSAGDGIQILAPDDGRVLARIPVPEPPANCTFGGEDGRCLFITARSALYAVAL
ncbi:MAG: SMP-30/gluconolactonase/LRE family protein [Lentisphaeria bacterium]|jgi:gluconolactonase